ncbi:methylase of polypeptide subunit release factors [Roseiarcus fermentans]|uniref:Methylase of polypeptide subunit release factors n=1 Tax=Roseiarcus fermentans TaxID=1473586 RepID=A0A366FFU1_9HYPH|nr:class I SAM-dependent methyltransferase [Roseiarcus fermentans]RBP12830.1 methylase of polypeptide subunit release factors [Roseiarcus fermentans]
MNIEYRTGARLSVLRKLGVADLVNTSVFDIAAAHAALVRRQAVPERILTDGLVVDVPAGVYHPLPDSSSEFFIRNIKAMDQEKIRKTLEIGAGCGIISLYMAANWTSRTVATDISEVAVQATLDNAALNGLTLTAFQSDLFEKIEERDFDLIVFNTPMIDKTPENDIEKFSLCDPHGLITDSYLRQARHHVSNDGLIIFSICNNSAYEVMDSIDLDYSIVGFELGFSGFWRAIVGARV